MPKSGGTYVYIERAFGPLFGTVSGLGLWLSLLLKSAFSLVGLSAYLYVLVQIDEGLSKIVALISLALILVLNIFGVKKVGNTQLAIVSISIISLVLVVVFGAGSFDSEMLSPVFSDGNYDFSAGSNIFSAERHAISAGTKCFLLNSYFPAGNHIFLPKNF